LPDQRRDIFWQDLIDLSPIEIAKELLLPVPWLAFSLFFASQSLYAIALAASFFFFLTGLRIVHGAYHYTLGLPRATTEFVMFFFSVLMLGSMHAIQWNHLRHHKHCLEDDDLEAMSARITAFRAIATGPLFPLRLHRKAISCANRRQRGWICLELGANVVWVITVFGILNIGVLRYHVLAMMAGQCLTSLFAVWTVHHGCDGSRVVARTIRSRIKIVATYNMFFHAEHNLFPRIPTSRLHILAQRLDWSVPGLERKLVF
jgi:fatty acid desaturase